MQRTQLTNFKGVFKMKNVYTIPELQFISFSSNDVIATSGEPVVIISNEEIGIDAGFIF